MIMVGTHGTFYPTDGDPYTVEVLAWATGGTAETVIIDRDGTALRVNPVRVHPL